MAIIRDNRGSLLASSIAQYLSAVSNTTGTPIDTNELVNIVNQFLGQGEQISAEFTTITNGIYKKFGPVDKVTNRTEIVTSGIWSDDTGSLTAFYTASEQIQDVSGKYYIDVYPNANTGSAEVQFSIAYGDINGWGAPTLDQDDKSYLSTKAVYSQLRNVLLGSGDSNFSVYGGNVAGATDLSAFYAININRSRYKERLDPGNISIKLTGANGEVTLIDDSGGTDENVSTAGRVYNMVSGALNIGSALTATINSYTCSATNGSQGWGLFYPDMGIIILNPTALKDVDVKLARANGSAVGVYHNNSLSGSTYSHNSGSVAVLNALASGSDFQARRTENVSTSHYFVRANNREFNFSNNPTFVTGSTGQFVQTTFEKNPKVYVTTVGLYDDASELLAVAKVSKPIEKSFDKEIAIKVKLDF